MASIISSLSFFCALLLLLIIDLVIYSVAQANIGVLEIEATHHVDVSTQSIFPTDVCDISQEFESSKIKVVHQHGPCSTNKKKLTHSQILNDDDIRVNWIHKKSLKKPTSSINHNHHKKNPMPASTIPAQRGIALGTGNYIVSLSFGTPKVAQSVVFDTGSDVTWIQCQPCVSACYQQKDPLFDPTKSSTYTNITCSSPYCSALDTSSCSGPTCLYAVQYGDNSYTVGFFAQDTLTLTASDVVTGFRFGCGEKNNGLFGQASGLLGLGRQQVSLVMQSFRRFGGVFSYCLPPGLGRSGYLTFGRSSAPKMQYTPMLSQSSLSTFYFLKMVGVSVGGQKLGISPMLFSKAGVLIDSGTVITRIAPTVYSALRTAFRKLMSKYPTAPAASILDTCYDLSKYRTVTIPKVGLQFQSAAMDLDISGILYVVSKTQACLAFAPTGDDSDVMIIGNTQQRRFNVVYDVGRKVIGFAAGAC